MSKQELLNRLAPEARDIFDQARQLALARGGILSPVHLLVALLEALLPARRNSKTTAGGPPRPPKNLVAARPPSSPRNKNRPKGHTKNNRRVRRAQPNRRAVPGRAYRSSRGHACKRGGKAWARSRLRSKSCYVRSPS